MASGDNRIPRVLYVITTCPFVWLVAFLALDFRGIVNSAAKFSSQSQQKSAQGSGFVKINLIGDAITALILGISHSAETYSERK